MLFRSVETFPGEDSPQDKVPCLEGARADMAAVVAMEILLVPCRSQGCIAAEPFEQQQVVVAELVQLGLLEGQDSRRAMGDLAGEDSFSAVDEGERHFTSGLCWRGADGPEHRWELIDPVLDAGLKAVETPCLETSEHLSICSLGLPIAAWVSHRGVADLGAEAPAVFFEGAADELLAVVGDDAVGHAKAADQTPDELDR